MTHSSGLYYTVYPRACGGTRRIRLANSLADGLSPRLRGNLALPDDNTKECRSIPAPAGEPSTATYHSSVKKVYPRACGGTRPFIAITSCCKWSIPAPAGEPPPPWSGPRRSGVYPRACGGTVLTAGVTPASRGLSPRLRGNPRAAPAGRGPVWSIPAPAGEPPARL